MNLFRSNVARPPEPTGPRQKGERCELSDLLVTQCSCRIHNKEAKGDRRQRDAEPEEFDFR